MKIYTKKGDDGTTGLLAGGRVPKSDPRVDLYGTVDELNSFLGCAIAFLQSETLKAHLQKQQHLLFELGAELAGLPGETSAIRDEDIAELESLIDEYEGKLPPLSVFVLPGGGRSAAFLHVCRTVCRRLERDMVAGAGADNSYVRVESLRYANRLSDYLFMAARLANSLEDREDIAWKSARNRKK